MIVYLIDKLRFVLQFLPVKLRTNQALLVWLDCFMSVLRQSKNDFDVFREQQLDELQRNGQVIRLTSLINRLCGTECEIIDSLQQPEFDFDVRISDNFVDALILSNLADRPVYLSNEIALSVVNQSDIALAERVRLLVEKYKISGKRFRVVVV